MVERFLKAKHWQLFVIGFAIPGVLQFVLFLFIMVKMLNIQDSMDSPEEFFYSGILQSYVGIFVVAILSAVVLYGWIYSVGVGLKKYLPNGLKSRTKFFIFCMIFPYAYIGLFFIIQVISFSSFFLTMLDPQALASPETMAPNFLGMMGLMLFIIPLHLFAMFCGIYVLRFVAKILRSVELQRRARFGDYIGYFFGVWFFPIGIWFLQPRINEIVSHGSLETNQSEEHVLDN